jgi:hypothetical protein
VVKLCKLDLGDEVVIAKINQAAAVDFKLDTDSLIALRQQDVSKAVIEAMLKRATAAPVPGPAEPPGVSSSAAATATQVATEEGVWLRTSQGSLQLDSVLGDQSLTYAAVVYLVFLDFPGLEAETRIVDRRPTIIVRLSKSPRGRIFLVKAERDENDGVRSVKVGRASMFGAKSWSSPDKDWTIECDVQEKEGNIWELTPKVDLQRGEYGVLLRGGLGGLLGAEQGELFDFGID